MRSAAHFTRNNDKFATVSIDTAEEDETTYLLKSPANATQLECARQRGLI
jgi:hypothetical protein